MPAKVCLPLLSHYMRFTLILAYLLAVAGFLAGMYCLFFVKDYSEALVYLCCSAIFSSHIVRKRRQSGNS